MSHQSNSSEKAPRYEVREVTGMCRGAGTFVVRDNDDGSEWGETMWRDEADKLAARWNAQDRTAIQRATT